MSAGAPTPGVADVATPTLRRSLRRALPWLVLAAAVLLVVGILAAASQTGSGSQARLAADNPGPSGAQAVVEVLRQHGVDVTIADDLGAAVGAVESPDDTTLLVSDPNDLLDPLQLARLRGDAPADLVLVEPTFGTLTALAPGVHLAGTTSGTLRADCAVPAVRTAGSVHVASAVLYTADADAEADTCLRSGGDDRGALVRFEADGVRTTVLGTGDALTNGQITTAGDAALALNLLGSHRHLVWYLPTFADVAGQGQSVSLADLTPAWVAPFAALLLLALLATAVWRGRRLGRIVVENLPVTVRARETMEGRARLYEKANARGHALDALRVGTVDRLAVVLGLPRTATVDEVIAAASSATRRDPAEIADVLVAREPRNDAELVALSDALLRLERDTATAVRG